jgi:putative endonuclease
MERNLLPLVPSDLRPVHRSLGVGGSKSYRGIQAQTIKSPMNNKFYVYMLRCNDGTFYVGHTDDLERRLAEHNAGRYEGYTSTRRPLTIVYSQDFGSRDDAKKAEWKLKRWSTKKKQALINNNWETISLFGKKKFE